jgi:hypothetical protein
VTANLWLPPKNDRITPTSPVDLSVVYRQIWHLCNKIKTCFHAGFFVLFFIFSIIMLCNLNKK